MEYHIHSDTHGMARRCKGHKGSDQDHQSIGTCGFCPGIRGYAPYVIRRHIVPDLYTIMITAVVMQSVRAILSESGLAFLGLGDPSYPSWGSMIKYAISYPMIFFTDAWMWWLLPAGT